MLLYGQLLTLGFYLNVTEPILDIPGGKNKDTESNSVTPKCADLESEEVPKHCNLKLQNASGRVGKWRR